MNFARLLAQIKQDEGFRSSVYLDSLSVPTIGYGATYIAGERVTMDTPDVSHPVALSILMGDVYGACVDAQAIFSRFNSLSYDRQEVLVNMAFNLGKNGLSKFVNMRAAIDAGDFNRAAMEMISSNWYVQVGNRAKRLVNRMA